MYTTNIIREYMTKMLSKKNKTDAVIINMTKYESWQTRPEDTRIIAVVKKDEINIQNSLEYIMIDPYDMLWYVKKETNNTILKKVPLGKDLEMIIKNVPNGVDISRKLQKNRW